MVIGILYIAIGPYSKFWDGFYESCQKCFLPDIKKEYIVFTDQVIKVFPSVKVCYQKNLGWPGNTLFRFQMFLKHKEELKKYDYLFFFNGNTEFKNEITSKEFLPSRDESFLICLSWHIYAQRSLDTYPYERNPASTAYIPYGIGESYYQGGMNGGRMKEYICLIEECDLQIRKDEENGIVACSHDESHINKYLLSRCIKLVGTQYGCPQEWAEASTAKIIFRDKNLVLGKRYMRDMKKEISLFKLLCHKLKTLCAIVQDIFSCKEG